MEEHVHVPKQPGAEVPKRRLHWHVFLTHFPIAFFGGAFGFQILHLFMSPACFELATNVALIAGVVSLGPAIWTGWWEWKHYYHGARALIFVRKIWISVGLVALGVPLLVWRVAGYGLFAEASGSPEHWVYLAGNTLLIIGAVLEGLYGGRLAHR
jgi:hypothetical protein